MPKLIAIARIVREPEKYGVTLPEIPDEPYFEIVHFNGQLDLSQAAHLADIELEELYYLNPGFNQWATPPTGPHYLLVPAGHGEIFQTRLARLSPDERVNWTRHRVKPGESLLTLAKKYRTTVDVIREINGIRGNLIRAGQTLMIPSAFKTGQYYAWSQAARLARKQSRAPRGYTRKLTYTVRKGDTIWDISRKFGVSHRALAKWNGMAPTDPLMPGRKLVIWQRSASQVRGQIAERSIIRKVGYRVRSGDSLYRIADRFNVSVADIVKWNDLRRDAILRPGQSLRLYVDVTQTN
ncbi:LysM peptidoglycan-binding domain-containing protein [Hahella sp. SMD15-11]|uniref:LysM peptidoglycan-binding domain-containing protein n=1 Tax=Thermohahella caldifontis TaxID=3142973 RepID=A0AB39UXQ1_9GAMM